MTAQSTGEPWAAAQYRAGPQHWADTKAGNEGSALSAHTQKLGLPQSQQVTFGQTLPAYPNLQNP